MSDDDFVFEPEPEEVVESAEKTDAEIVEEIAAKYGQDAIDVAGKLVVIISQQKNPALVGYGQIPPAPVLPTEE